MSEERRVVTILFADVTGSTAMGESSDPEDVRALLGRYYAIAREVVAAHGGTLEKFIGDAVMAVFGIPQAHGDDAERGLVAALALRAAVARDPQTAALVLRIGVNTGEVVAARDPDAGDFLVTGDAVNVAARMQQHAEPGAILVGERTRRAVSGFRFGEEQRLAVKGKREPISGSVLLERLAERTAPRAPFLGRDHDLAQLDLVARRAFTERRPQLVTITAPAGTGKSRLVEEFARRIGGGVTVATAQCLPYGSAVTFLPLRGLLRGLLNAPREEDVGRRVRAAFGAGGHSEEDAGRLAVLIGVTLGDTTQSEPQDRDQVFTAWRLLIELLAAKGPLVVVFEDIHWASDTLLDLVEHVTLSRAAAPLVIFALARPELLDRKPNWGGGRRNFTALGLEPLDDTQTRGLVSALTGEVPAAIVERIAERSGGNPFFAGELVRAYEERRREGALDTDIVLPDTVHATVLARIDALPPGERSALQLAAVAGRTARSAAIHALQPDAGEDATVRSLDALAERDLLTPQGGGTYTFRHIVIREVAYSMLPRAERVRAHLRLARWLEDDSSGAANENAELVAYHYRQAIALSPGGRVPDGLPVSTVIAALERAARGASLSGAFHEAGELLHETLRLAPEDQGLHLLELRGDLMRFGDHAISGYMEGYERWRKDPGGDPGTGARLLVKGLAVLARWPGSLAQQMERTEFEALAEEAQRLLALAPDEMLEARLTCARALNATRFTNLDPALVAEMARGTQMAADLFAARGELEAESEALDALSAVLRNGFQDPAGALEVTRRRSGKIEQLSMLERIDIWSMTTWDLVHLGRYADAIAAYREACRTRRAGEPEYLLTHAGTWATYASMLCGRWDETLELGDALLAMREESHLVISRFTFPGWVGAMRVASARLDTTRLARYRSAFVAVANVEVLRPAVRDIWNAFIDRDAAAARRFLAGPLGLPDRKGELIALMLFELGEPMAEADLAALERQGPRPPQVLALRIRLARALNGDVGDVRSAIRALDEGHLVADAARAATLLALRTREKGDRADAERRLTALGDRGYLLRIEEEW